jgi:cytidylate kinase
VAEWLGWMLLDQNLIDAIAQAARVDSDVVNHFDEHVDSWLHRLNAQAMHSVALAAGLPLNENEGFDARIMAKFTHQVIEEAYSRGNCVIVGRGAQCILEHWPDVYHVFVYAPFRDRLQRLRERLEPGTNIEHRIHKVDEERTRYLQQQFGKRWNDPHLYDLMISSRIDEDATARVILHAMTGRLQLPADKDNGDRLARTPHLSPATNY